MPDSSTPHLRASELIGQIALTFSILEDDIDACLQAMIASDASIAQYVLDKLGFREKLDTVHRALSGHHAGNRERLAELHRWRRRADRIRARRNGVVHGLWEEDSQSIRADRSERLFNVHELSAELDALRRFREVTARAWFDGEAREHAGPASKDSRTGFAPTRSRPPPPVGANPVRESFGAGST